MKAAKPKQAPAPLVSSARGVDVPGIVANRATDAYPGLMPGWDPASGKPQPTQSDLKVFVPGTAAYERVMAAAQPTTFGSPPANPIDYANYGKFQRWTWYGAYVLYPTSTIGKMFFTQNGKNFVCSGTVINRNTFLTAGHCVSDGAGNWSSNIMLCPSYNAGGVNPQRGCWSWASATTSSTWHSSGDIDRDYACVVTQKTGTVHANSIGNITGWIGYAWNWPRNQMVFSTGYPQGSPFQGVNIIFTAGVEWYSINMGGDGAVSKYIGNDMTGGSSGGSWWLNIAHASKEYLDLDGDGQTDPLAGGSSPFANGVNSHARCMGSCFTPPTALGGTFWDEMGSPDFTDGAGSVVDILNTCFNGGGS